MEWTTKISKIENDGTEVIRGEKLSQLISDKSFGEMIFFILQGRFPKKNEQKMFNAILVSAIDHGVGTASAMTARIAAAAKTPMHASLAAGILAMGDLHGGAIEGAANFFKTNCGNSDISGLVKDCKTKGMRIPGYGHAVLKTDERSTILFSIAKAEKIYGTYCEFSERVLKEVNSISSKALPLNIDGAMAALLLDMNFEPSVMRGVFIIARMPGLVAHVYEEMSEGKGLRRLEESEIIYKGE